MIRLALLSLIAIALLGFAPSEEVERRATYEHELKRARLYADRLERVVKREVNRAERNERRLKRSLRLMQRLERRIEYLESLPRVDTCLAKLIALEGSHCDPTATNPTSGAYGIPQALPGSKMASAGADWRTNPATQIRWMIGYVNARYGGSCKALAYHYANGYY